MTLSFLPSFLTHNTLATTAVVLTLAILPPLLLFNMSLFKSKSRFPVADRAVLITGGSQGLGLSTAIKLAARGAHIAIVARDTAKLKSALFQIQSAASAPNTQRFLSLSYDLTDPRSAPEILRKITEWNHGSPPDVVWCCAGYCIPSFFADADIKTLREQMDVLFWSCAYMAHATLNLWKQPNSSSSALSTSTTGTTKEPQTRHLIFTSSCLAFFPVAGYAPYSPAKAAMRCLADTLQQEIAVWNGARHHKPSATTKASPGAPPAEIQLHTIFPMGISSPSFTNEEAIKPAITKEFEKSDKPQTPDQVADAAIAGLDKGEQMITTMLLGHLMKGAGHGASLRWTFMDVFWNWLGQVIAMFVGWDFLKQGTKWGEEHGLRTGPA